MIQTQPDATPIFHVCSDMFTWSEWCLRGCIPVQVPGSLSTPVKVLHYQELLGKRQTGPCPASEHHAYGIASHGV